MKKLAAENLLRPRERAPVDEAKARAFVEAEEVSAKPIAKRPRTSRLRRGEGGVRVAIYLPEDLEEALRLRCAQERRSMSDAVTEAVRALLKKQTPKAL